MENEWWQPEGWEERKRRIERGQRREGSMKEAEFEQQKAARIKADQRVVFLATQRTTPVGRSRRKPPNSQR